MLKKVNCFLTTVEEVIGTTCICAMFLLVLVGCIARYLFNSPIAWVEEVTNLLLIWMGYLAICYATAKGGHVSIDFITNKLSPKVHAIWYAVLQIIVFITFALLFPAAAECVKYQIKTPALNIDLKVMFLIIPGTCLFLMFHTLINTIDLIRRAAGKEK